MTAWPALCCRTIPFSSPVLIAKGIVLLYEFVLEQPSHISLWSQAQWLVPTIAVSGRQREEDSRFAENDPPHSPGREDSRSSTALVALSGILELREAESSTCGPRGSSELSISCFPTGRRSWS